jgi:hypothetical protein
MLENLDLSQIQDENARELIGRLLNLVEKLSADLRDAQAENQRLRDEVNRLKGEQNRRSRGIRPNQEGEIIRRRKSGGPRGNGIRAAKMRIFGSTASRL